MSIESITPGSTSRSAQDDDPMEVDSSDINIPYNREFEDSVMKVVLDPPAPDGIEVREPLPPYLASRPDIPPEDLPLPLADLRRQFKSEIPGIRLTHHRGRYEGGPDASSEEDRQFAQELVQKHGVKTKEDLDRAIAYEMENAKQELREKMQRRKEAIEENEKVESDLQTLKMDREFELNAQKRIIEKAKAKKEERKAKRTKLGPTSEHPARSTVSSAAFIYMTAPLVGDLTNPGITEGDRIRASIPADTSTDSSDLEEGEIREEEEPHEERDGQNYSISAGRRSGMFDHRKDESLRPRYGRRGR